LVTEVSYAASNAAGEADRVAELAAERLKGFDPVKLSEILEKRVVRGLDRKYYRFRASRFYGGSAVGDVVLCNLRCIFCWTGRPRDDPRIGFFVSPAKASRILLSIARSKGYNIVRLSAGEPTLGWRHLLELIGHIENEDPKVVFVLETNGILLAAYPSRVKALNGFGRIHVRVSLKACNSQWFKVLTGADSRFFHLPLKAIKLLYENNISFHFSLFMGFGTEKCWRSLLERLATEISEEVLGLVELEPLVLYSSVKRRLKFLLDIGVKPNRKYTYMP